MVSLTRRAAETIRTQKEDKKYIRLENGEQGDTDKNYKVSFTDEVNRDDILYMSYGIRILVGSDTRSCFENLKVDYIGQNGKGRFIFNPMELYVDM